MRKNGIHFFVFLLCLSFAVTQGCAVQEPSPRVEKHLPQDTLAQYNDSFDRLRMHLWELSQLTYNETQTANFKLADMRVEEGRLKVTTKTGGFSKGGLITKYEFRGDFDIQIDCEFDFSRTIPGMDQRVILALTEKDKKLSDSHQAIVQLLKRPGADSGMMQAFVVRYGQYLGGAKNERGKFNGTVRFVRTGGRIRMLYKTAGAAEWTSLCNSAYTKNDVIFGFAVQNFTFRRKRIDAKESISATFDNFKINAAQDIIESEI